MAAKAADGPLLDRDQRLVVRRQPQDQGTVQRLGEPGVGDGRHDAAGGQRLGRGHDLGQAGAERQDRHALALLHHAALADLERLRDGRHLDPHSLATRKAERDGALVMRCCRGHHANEFSLVRRRHHHEPRQIRKERHIEGPGMSTAVRAHEPGPVDGEPHRQALDRDVVDDLIVAALQEC